MYVSTQEIAGTGPKCVRCVISQNSRRKVTQRAGYRKETQKVSAEGERSNALYCMCNTLQFGQVAKKKDAWNLQATVQKEATVLVLRAKQTAATFFCFLCTKMAAPFYTHTEVCYAGHKMTF